MAAQTTFDDLASASPNWVNTGGLHLSGPEWGIVAVMYRQAAEESQLPKATLRSGNAPYPTCA
ncbi:MAG: hypothetical protein ACRBBU_07435 [Pseudooceanicola sp.]